MEEDANKLIDGKPAGYSSTSATELESKNIFQSLLDTRFIKGEIRVMDKYPNSDGILEITDEEQIPIGKIDIQLKTLQPKNFNSPSYQCERTFFSYCENSSLPVFLVVVDRQNKKAYWRHIDAATLIEVASKMTGASYTISIPIENCIDGEKRAYIEKWAEKAKETVNKVWNYDTLRDQKRTIETQLEELNHRLQNPTKLPLQVLKSIHNYLDKYNYILDIEFGSVKEILYPNYWKIGIGIVKYEFADIRYILFPVEYKKEQTLIKEVVFDANTDIGLEMMNGNILVFVHSKSLDNIRDFPVQTAYKSLEDSILKVAGKFKFPIADDFIAHEYLVSFIDHNCVYLDMEPGQDSYSLQELKYKIFKVLPVLAATELSFADWVTECNHSIDSYSGWKTSPHFKKRVKAAIEKVQEGFVPKVKVFITSELYNIDLIKNYINYLQNKGFVSTNRQYQQGQSDQANYRNSMPFKDTWDIDVLWKNTILFFKQYYKLYDKYISTHFLQIRHLLQIIPSESGTVICLLITDKVKGGPYLEIYYLRPELHTEKELYFFVDTDADNPIDRKKFLVDDEYECIVNRKKYQITHMHIQTLDFMFEISPTYALINKKLQEKLGEFFREKQRKVKQD
ncbi:DUF4365 domain-containing protein [Lacibacter luteus]|uniref:DUF4365 domain-containing protein n=1 Tax=Lacibacter luteus TaxID=2508719 RepID=A0A4Q1CH41_9BACT|nr:DUF4365 domain-containing protein [Lacibacter luteus]RXK59211.1 DUF4365 domain-containing protein [Lacibacter luteus]